MFLQDACAFCYPLWWLPLMTTPWGLSILVPWLKGWAGGCCCGVGAGVSSVHMDHGIRGIDGCMALRFSKLICNKVVVTVC